MSTEAGSDRLAWRAAINAVFRDEVGAICASLTRQLGDIDVAEDLVHDAVVIALQRWPRDGVPARPGAWLLETARNRGIDKLRRETRYRAKLQALREMSGDDGSREPEDRLRLIFTCCHPMLGQDSQVALTLRAVMGMTTAQIARAFVVPESTMAQRIVRAKRKIVEAKLPYRMPARNELPSRLDGVLSLLYLVFNEGYMSTGPHAATDRDLCADSLWLGELLDRLMPRQPEVMGLLALMRLHEARRASRFDDQGAIVLLEQQDRSRWDHAAITAASALLEEARRLGQPGQYWLQAAIAACHAEAPTYDDTDWPQILALYGALLRVTDNPVARLNRAVALWHVAGPSAALSDVEALAPQLARYHLYHSLRAQLLHEFGRHDEARAATAQALRLTDNPAERALLQARLDEQPRDVSTTAASAKRRRTHGQIPARLSRRNHARNG